MSEGRERSHSLSEDEDAERSRREAALEIVMSATLPERRNSAVSRAVSKLTNGKFVTVGLARCVAADRVIAKRAVGTWRSVSRIASFSSTPGAAFASSSSAWY